MHAPGLQSTVGLGDNEVEDQRTTSARRRYISNAFCAQTFYREGERDEMASGEKKDGGWKLNAVRPPLQH